MVTGNNTDGLERFAQTHIITKNAMKVVAVEESQPVNTLLLVRSEFCLDCDRDLEFFHLADIEHLSHELPFPVTSFEQLL